MEQIKNTRACSSLVLIEFQAGSRLARQSVWTNQVVRTIQYSSRGEDLLR